MFCVQSDTLHGRVICPSLHGRGICLSLRHLAFSAFCCYVVPICSCVLRPCCTSQLLVHSAVFVLHNKVCFCVQFDNAWEGNWLSFCAAREVANAMIADPNKGTLLVHNGDISYAQCVTAPPSRHCTPLPSLHPPPITAPPLHHCTPLPSLHPPCITPHPLAPLIMSQS